MDEALRRRKRRRTAAALEMGLAVSALSLMVVAVLSSWLSEVQVVVSAALAALAGVFAGLSSYHSEVLPSVPTRYRLMVGVTSAAAEAGDLGELELRLLGYLAEHAVFTPAQLAEEWGVSVFEITAALLRLEREGLVVIRGITWE